MLGSYLLQKGPLFDPCSKIKNFVHDEDFNMITQIAVRDGVLYTEPSPHPDLGADIEWRRPKEICDLPHFVNRKPDRFDALQGKLGDCWLVIAIEGLTFDADLFNFVVPENQGFDWRYTGAFHFRFWQLGTWYDVVVDDRLPVYKISKKLCYAHSRSGKVFWAALLEKAYRKICGRRSRDYASLNVGLASTAFQDLSGGIIEVVKPAEPPPGKPFKWFLKELFGKRAFAGCLISGDEENLDPNTGLFSGHGYLVTGVYYNKDDDPKFPGLLLVRLQNPWGDVEWSGEWSDKNVDLWRETDRENREKMEFKIENDGEFWMSEIDFVKHFNFVFICHLGPSQYLYCHLASRVETWSTTSFHGEWIKDFSAGGRLKNKRHINPQYKFLLKSPQDVASEDSIGTVTVVIDLTHRSLLNRSFRTIVGFCVYYLNNSKDPKETLSQDFFNKNEPKNDLDLSKSEGRSYVESMKLFPGWYCIIPFTDNEGEESSFLLRIFTESAVERWEYDTVVSKMSPLKEETNDIVKYDKLKEMFDVAALNEEVDWIGLKDIFKRHSKQPTSFVYGFSKDECRDMIATMDQDHSSKLNYHEFCCLWKNIRYLSMVYERFRDSDGYMKVVKLRDALSSIGYNLNKQVVNKLIRFYESENGQIILKDFIICGLILEAILIRYDKDQNIKYGANFTLEEWVKNTLAV